MAFANSTGGLCEKYYDISTNTTTYFLIDIRDGATFDFSFECANNRCENCLFSGTNLDPNRCYSAQDMGILISTVSSPCLGVGAAFDSDDM